MEFETNKGKVVVKEAEISELKELIPVYKGIFKVHNIFTKSEGEILKYFEKNVSDFMIALVDGKVVGGILVKLARDYGEHGIWRYKHIAVAEGYRDLEIGTHLFEAADKKVKEKGLKTNKIEIHVSQNEEATLPFFKKMGFKIEGELISHYQFGEKVYFLGKEV